MKSTESRRINSTPDYFLLAIVTFTVLSRVMSSGPVYFGDGPEHMLVIREHTYLLQPPGYWLFNRFAGLFQDFESATLVMNWCFSALGVMVFHRVALELFEVHIARLGTIVYSVIFFAWFSGNVHSTYASQLLFPVLTFHFFVLHEKTHALRFLWCASIAFAVGAGLRPSDGAFLLPFFCYHLLKSEARPTQRILVSLLSIALCLIWLVPTLDNDQTVWEQLTKAADQTSVFRIGFKTGFMANVLRFLLPFFTAFWALFPLFFKGIRKCDKELLRSFGLWIIPGSAFFLLVYIADATYLDYLLAAVLLLAMCCASNMSARLGRRCLLACALWNAVFFLFFAPKLPLKNSSPLDKAIVTYEVYTGKYTRWAVQHQWEPRLSDVLIKLIVLD